MKILCVLSEFAYGKPERGENYDYVHFVPALERAGHEIAFFDSGDRSSYKDFAELNATLLARVDEFRPDIVFCVLMHYEIWLETLDIIRANSPAVIVNWGTDDSWKFKQASRFFARHVDLHVTTDPGTERAVKSAGLPNIFGSQWAASSETLREPLPSSKCRYDVSFVGSMYGYRAQMISALRQKGIAVSCFGHGTENGVVDAAAIPEIYRASRISLNFSGAGQNAGGSSGRQIKGRTFEVPGAGGFLLTESAPDLERYFAIDREIATFDTPDELIAKTRYFLDRPDARDSVARAGHERTRIKHTYERRFSEVMEQLQPIVAARAKKPWTLSSDVLDGAVRQYRGKTFVACIRPALVGALTLIFGKERGARAARRFLYEISWRISGETTYRARGLPGRLFYGES